MRKDLIEFLITLAVAIIAWKSGFRINQPETWILAAIVGCVLALVDMEIKHASQ